jgi:hypothetical protein
MLTTTQNPHHEYIDPTTGEIEIRDADWYRDHRQHFPFTKRGPMSPAQLQWVTELLEAHPYRFARTMPNNPHFYTLRYEWADVGEATFEQVVRMIREHGVTEWWGGFPWRMLYTGDYKYWSYFSSYVEEVVVLNRKPITPQETNRR